MKLTTLLIVLTFWQVSLSQSGIITDKRNGIVYKMVQIGAQTWMAENLNVSTFINGDIIPESKTQVDWDNAGKNNQPTWCYYNNDPKNGAIYGKLYNWYAVNDPRGLSPIGYHVATEDEWKTLTTFLGGESMAGVRMKNSPEWWGSCEIYETYGFSAIPAGIRYASYQYSRSSTFENLGESGYFWSSTELSSIVALYRHVGCSPIVNIDADFKEVGMSVRCVKD